MPGCSLPWWSRYRCVRRSPRLTTQQGFWDTTGCQNTTGCWWATRTKPEDSRKWLANISGNHEMITVSSQTHTHNFYLCCVWIPAQNPAILPTAQKQLRICYAPGNGQDTPVKWTVRWKRAQLFKGLISSYLGTAEFWKKKSKIFFELHWALQVFASIAQTRGNRVFYGLVSSSLTMMLHWVFQQQERVSGLDCLLYLRIILAYGSKNMIYPALDMQIKLVRKIYLVCFGL